MNWKVRVVLLLRLPGKQTSIDYWSIILFFSGRKRHRIYTRGSLMYLWLVLVESEVILVTNLLGFVFKRDSLRIPWLKVALFLRSKNLGLLREKLITVIQHVFYDLWMRSSVLDPRSTPLRAITRCRCLIPNRIDRIMRTIIIIIHLYRRRHPR